MKKVTHVTEEGGMMFAVAYEATEELDKAQAGPGSSAGRDGGHA